MIEFQIGFYPGVLLGSRVYRNQVTVSYDDGSTELRQVTNLVLYIPFVDVCVSFYGKEIVEE